MGWGWEGKGGKGEKGDLGCFPTSSCSLWAAVGWGWVPSHGDSTCLAPRARERSEPPTPAAIRLRCVPALGRAGISLGGRADSGNRRGNPVFPSSPSLSAFTYLPFPISLCFKAGRLGRTCCRREELPPRQQQPPLKIRLCLPRSLIPALGSSRCDAVLPRAECEASIQGNGCSACQAGHVGFEKQREDKQALGFSPVLSIWVAKRSYGACFVSAGLGNFPPASSFARCLLLQMVGTDWGERGECAGAASGF